MLHLVLCLLLSFAQSQDNIWTKTNYDISWIPKDLAISNVARHQLFFHSKENVLYLGADTMLYEIDLRKRVINSIEFQPSVASEKPHAKEYSLTMVGNELFVIETYFTIDRALPLHQGFSTKDFSTHIKMYKLFKGEIQLFRYYYIDLIKKGSWTIDDFEYSDDTLFLYEIKYNYACVLVQNELCTKKNKVVYSFDTKSMVKPLAEIDDWYTYEYFIYRKTMYGLYEDKSYIGDLVYLRDFSNGEIVHCFGLSDSQNAFLCKNGIVFFSNYFLEFDFYSLACIFPDYW